MQDDPMRSAFEPPTQALPPQVGHPTCVMHFRSQALFANLCMVFRAHRSRFCSHAAALVCIFGPCVFASYRPVMTRVPWCVICTCEHVPGCQWSQMLHLLKDTDKLSMPLAQK